MARRGRYRMTPRRRAALKKAQKASARKRRRTVAKKYAKAGAIVAGGITVSAAAANFNYALNHPVKTGRKIRQAGRNVKGYLSIHKMPPPIVKVVPVPVKKHPIGYYPSKSTQRASYRRIKRGRLH